MRKPLYHKKIILLSILIGILSFSLPFKLLAKKQEKLNVILIVVDALRADHLSCYGYNRSTSPNIDNLAKEGILFRQAFSQGSCTSISTLSMFTSLYPEVLKIPRAAAYLPDEFTTLPDVLNKNGYITAAFVGPTLASFSNFSYRFGAYDEVASLGFGANRITPQINAKASAWLKQNRRQPFFLYLHYFGAHDPYSSPSPYNTFFWPKEITDEMEEFVSNFARGIQGEYTDPPQEDMLDFIISQYDGRIRYVDIHIEFFLEELERLGLSENTLIILTADHGEGFSEHGKFFHSNSLYSELIHVPLIMRLPEILPQDKVVPNLVRLIDVMPTILDILDIPSHNIMQGESLFPLIRGGDMPKLDSFSEAHLGPLKGIRKEKWAFIAAYDSENNPSAFELYDLELDPKEMNNLVEKKPKEVEIFKAGLRDYVIWCERIRDSILGEDFIDKPLILDEETKKRLKSLGYLQ